MRLTKRGFSLVEVLVGVTILVVGFLPVYLFLFSSETVTAESVHQIESLARAQALLDAVACLPWRSLGETERIAAEDLPVKLGIDPARLPLLPPEDRSRFDRSVEIFAGDRCFRIKVCVTDQGLADRSAGRRGETILATLVMRP